MTESDDTIATAGSTARLCGYSGCRTPIPPTSGPGNRARYCQDGKAWGTKELSCKQAALALENAASLRGTDALGAAAVDELTERIHAAVGPARQLVDALAGTHTQLDETIRVAQCEQKQAENRAVEAEGKTAQAKAAATRATRMASEAAESAATAERSKAAAESAAEKYRNTTVAAVRGEELATERAQRAERNATEAAALAARLQSEIAAVTSTSDSLGQALEDERSRHRAAVERLDRLPAEHRSELAELRTAHEASISTLAAEHRATMAAAQREHDSAIANSDAAAKREGEQQQRIRDSLAEELATARADARHGHEIAERAHIAATTSASELSALREELLGLLADRTGTDDPEMIRARVRAALNQYKAS